MKTTLAPSFAPACALIVLAACGGPAATAPKPAAVPPPGAQLPASTKAEVKSDPAFATCHNTYKPTSGDQDVGADLAAMTKGCIDVTKMKKLGATLSGQLSESSPPATFPLGVQAGKCYRFYGMAQSTMQDFDIALIDSTGALVSEDTTDDVSPVTTEDGKVCFKVADAAVIRASAGAGAGKFALEIWSD
jgi:hypothetical protein